MKNKIDKMLRDRPIKDKLNLVFRMVTISFLLLVVVSLAEMVMSKNIPGIIVILVLAILGIAFNAYVMKRLAALLVAPIESLVVAAEKISQGDFEIGTPYEAEDELGGLSDTFETAATINTGRPGIFHGMKSYFCQDKYGQIAPVYSISAGLDYPGIGPEHAWLHDTGRASYVPVTDDEAVNAFEYLSRTEGIIPAIESAHAVAHAMKIAGSYDKDKIMVITISGRGDKDCAAIARYRGEDIHE